MGMACALSFIGREVVGKIKLIWRQQIWVECQILFLFVFIASRQFQISDNFLPIDIFFMLQMLQLRSSPKFSFKSLGCTVKLSPQQKKELKRRTVLLCFPKLVDVYVFDSSNKPSDAYRAIMDFADRSKFHLVTSGLSLYGE